VTIYLICAQVKAAKEQWRVKHKGNDFPYMHCWEILREEPKWMAKVFGEEERPSKGKAPAAGSGSAQGSDAPSEEDSGRPIGRDRAKKQRSAEIAATAASSACLEILQDLAVSRKAEMEAQSGNIVDLMDSEAKKVALKERLVRSQEELVSQNRAFMQFQMEQAARATVEAEERVMSMDLSNMTAEARAYWKGRQAEVLKKRNWSA
jgi:hypothetical protein